MMFFEVLTPPGALDDQQRHALGESIATALFDTQSAPAEVLSAARRITHVLVHETHGWMPGAPGTDPADPPHYLVRITVPEAWREEMSAHLIATVTKLIAEIDPEPATIYTTPRLWVHVAGVAEGSCGALGKVQRGTDIGRMITAFYSADTTGRPDDQPADGLAADPNCGMTVPIAGNDIILKHGETTYYFCSSACRDIFIEDLATSGTPTHPQA